MQNKTFEYSYNNSNSAVVKLNCPSDFELVAGDSTDYVVVFTEVKDTARTTTSVPFKTFEQADMMFRGLVTGYLMINPI